MVLIRTVDEIHALALGTVAASAAARDTAARSTTLARRFPPRSFQPTLPSLNNPMKREAMLTPRPASARPRDTQLARTGPGARVKEAEHFFRPLSARSAPGSQQQCIAYHEPSWASQQDEHALNPLGGISYLPISLTKELDAGLDSPRSIYNDPVSAPRWMPMAMRVHRERSLPGEQDVPDVLARTNRRGRLAARLRAKSPTGPSPRHSVQPASSSRQWEGNGAVQWKAGHPPPRVRAEAEVAKMKLPAALAAAIDTFDDRHRQLTLGTFALNAALDYDVTSYTKQEVFRREVKEIFAQRLVVREVASGIVRHAKRQGPAKARSTWQLATSIYAPRVRLCDSKDFWDTPSTVRRLLELDWRRALNHGIEKIILRADDGNSTDGSETAAGDEVSEVFDVLWEFHEVLHLLFDYYASQGSSNNIFELRLNGYTELAETFMLVDPTSTHTNKTAWDGMFIAIDAAPARSKDGDLAEPYSSKKMLSRSDFLQLIVRAAISRYVLSKMVTDVSHAVRRLIETDFQPRMDPVIFSPANRFRDIIYVEDVDIVLRRHEASLRIIYAELCAMKQRTMELNGLANGLVSYPNFMSALRMFNLINADLTERDVTLSFVYARMKTINEHEHKSRVRMTHLNFIDFLEALCRLSQVKALPTDDEIAAGGSHDACTHLLTLASDNPAAYGELLATRAGRWGAVQPVQAIDRCVEFMCHLLIVQCQGGLDRNAASADLVLTEKQAKWAFTHNHLQAVGKCLLG